MTNEARKVVSADKLTDLYDNLLPYLFAAANGINKEWEYFGIFFWCSPCEIWHLEELAANGQSLTSWPSKSLEGASDALMDWWDDLNTSGHRMFSIMFLAGERSRGDVGGFLVYPEDAGTWDIPPGQERAVMDRAYAEIGWTINS